MTESHSCSVMFTITRSRRIPALFTSTCRSPNVSTAVWIRRWAPSQSATLSTLATRLAAHGLDLVDHLLRGRPVVAGPVDVAAEVVDHDLGALRGEEQRVLAAEATSCAGDDGNPAVECTHVRQSPAREVVAASDFGPGAW